MTNKGTCCEACRSVRYTGSGRVGKIDTRAIPYCKAPYCPCHHQDKVAWESRFAAHFEHVYKDTDLDYHDLLAFLTAEKQRSFEEGAAQAKREIVEKIGDVRVYEEVLRLATIYEKEKRMGAFWIELGKKQLAALADVINLLTTTKDTV